MRLAAVILLGASLLAGCADPQKDWELAARDDSTEAYLQFLAMHPDAEEADLARERIEQLKVVRAWERAEFKDSEEAYADFIERFPGSEFVEQAETRVAAFERDRRWELISDAPSSDALEGFIADYPQAPQRVDAEALLEEIRAAELAAAEAATPKERPGAFRLQLAAFRTASAAEKELRRLVAMFPDELLGPVRIETPADRNNDSGRFLLKTVPMSRDEADAVCDLLKRRQQQCLIINR